MPKIYGGGAPSHGAQASVCQLSITRDGARGKVQESMNLLSVNVFAQRLALQYSDPLEVSWSCSEAVTMPSSSQSGFQGH